MAFTLSDNYNCKGYVAYLSSTFPQRTFNHEIAMFCLLRQGGRDILVRLSLSDKRVSHSFFSFPIFLNLSYPKFHIAERMSCNLNQNWGNKKEESVVVLIPGCPCPLRSMWNEISSPIPRLVAGFLKYLGS